MIGSILVEEIIARELEANEGVVADVGEEIHASSVLPPYGRMPAVLYYMPSSTSYDGPMELAGPDDIASESLSFDVLAICEGGSHAPIRRAIRGQMEALSGREFDVTDEDGRTWRATFTARGEPPLPTRVIGDRLIKALGTRYDVTLERV